MPLTEIKVPIYCALLTQEGTAAPTAIVLQNNTGLNIVWGRTNTGIYTATAPNGFPVMKTYLAITPNNQGSQIEITFTNTEDGEPSSELIVKTRVAGVLTDNILAYTPVLIQIYNL